MRKFFVLLLFVVASLSVSAQSTDCLLRLTETDGDSVVVALSNVRLVLPRGTGSVLLTNERLSKYEVVEDVDSVTTLNSGAFVKFTDQADGNVKAINKTFIEKIIPGPKNKAVIVTRLQNGNFLTDETFVNIMAAATTCASGAGAGEANTASNLGAGQGIFGSKSGVDLRFKSLVGGTNVTLASDANTITINSTGGGGGGTSMAFDTLTSGAVVANVYRDGGTATSIANPSAGTYDITVPSGAFFEGASIFGNNTTLNPSNEFVLVVDNSANSVDRRFLVQLYDANNDALVDQQATGTVHVQAVAGSETTITFPGMNGFGASGFRIEIR